MILLSKNRQQAIHYEINPSLEPIGVGGTGTVRIGQMVDERTGMRRDVAIKFLYDDMPDSIVLRSQSEASIHILNDNLIEMIDFVQTTEQDAQGRTIVHSHVVSELLHGVMLLDLLDGVVTDKDGNELPAVRQYHDLMVSDRNRFALTIIRGVLSGIQALHDNGYIHRDIDPSNIMITDTGKVKLIDLGIAKKLDMIDKHEEMHLTQVGQFIGKPAYAAPELANGDLARQNVTTDIYAIGVMLYLLVVGKLPFEGSMTDVLLQQCKMKMPVGDISDRRIRKIVRKATEKQQSDRYQSAAEFRVAIDDYKPTPIPSYKKIIIIISAIALLLVIALAAILLLKDSRTTVSDSHEEYVDTTATVTEDTLSAIQQQAPAPVQDEQPSAATTEQENPSQPSVDNTQLLVKTQKIVDHSSSGGMTLSYGIYTGSVKNGYPYGKGTLVYTTSRRINRYDPKGIVAQPGEYVEGLFVNGFLTVGKHYSADGELLNKISAGVAEDVYEER